MIRYGKNYHLSPEILGLWAFLQYVIEMVLLSNIEAQILSMDSWSCFWYPKCTRFQQKWFIVQVGQMWVEKCPSHSLDWWQRKTLAFQADSSTCSQINTVFDGDIQTGDQDSVCICVSEQMHLHVHVHVCPCTCVWEVTCICMHWPWRPEEGKDPRELPGGWELPDVDAGN